MLGVGDIMINKSQSLSARVSMQEGKSTQANEYNKNDPILGEKYAWEVRI